MTFQHQLKVLRLSINLQKFLKIICQVRIINNVLHKCYVYAIHYSIQYIVKLVCVYTCWLANNYHMLVIYYLLYFCCVFSFVFFCHFICLFVLIFWFNIVFMIMGGQLDGLFVSLAACFLQINWLIDWLIVAKASKSLQPFLHNTPCGQGPCSLPLQSLLGFYPSLTL